MERPTVPAIYTGTWQCRFSYVFKMNFEFHWKLIKDSKKHDWTSFECVRFKLQIQVRITPSFLTDLILTLSRPRQ